jgi:ActR/RegA family two-component response regulator
VLTAQPRCFSSNNNRGILDTAVANTRTNRPRTVIMRQGIQSIFARIAAFLRRKSGTTTWASLSPASRSSMGPLGIIGLVTSDEDRRLLAGICNRNGWYLLYADTCEEARAALEKLKAPVILCDRDLPGKGWRETVEGLASSTHRACIILVSGVLDAYLWDEVVRTGGYDVLYKPLREDDVVRSVRLAWSYWKSATKTAALSGKRQDGET